MVMKYKSNAHASIHETMEALHIVGVVDKRAMTEFDEACLTPLGPLTPNEIRAIREQMHLSQSAFARYLYVNATLVSDWERGVKKPSGAALRLLTIVREKGLFTII